MKWKRKQRSNLSDTDPNIGTSLNPAVFKRHLKYLQLGVVMGLAGACCSVSNGLIHRCQPSLFWRDSPYILRQISYCPYFS